MQVAAVVDANEALAAPDKSVMSAKSRRKIAVAQKARWAKQKSRQVRCEGNGEKTLAKKERDT